MKSTHLSDKGLAFTCEQRTSDFRSQNGGFYCDQCKKTLIDFRQKTKSEFDEIRQQNDSFCGIYYFDQLGDNKRLQWNWRKPFMFIGVIFSLLISLPSKGQSTEKAKTEQSPFDSKTSVNTKTKDKETKPKSGLDKARTQKVPPWDKGLKIYYSRRFPFIFIKRRSHITGFGHFH